MKQKKVLLAFVVAICGMLFSCNRENDEVLSSNLKSTSVDNLSYTDIDNI